MKRIFAAAVAGSATAFALRLVYRLLARGALTIDIGVGRRLRPLGPLTWTISAPPELVFDVIAAH